MNQKKADGDERQQTPVALAPRDRRRTEEGEQRVRREHEREQPACGGEPRRRGQKNRERADEGGRDELSGLDGARVQTQHARLPSSVAEVLSRERGEGRAREVGRVTGGVE